MASKYDPLSDEVYDYVSANRSNADDPLLKALRVETQNFGDPGRQAIGLDRAAFIGLMVQSIGAKWAVEIGTFTGTSSLCIARALAPGGRLVCFEQDFKATSMARRYWIRAGIQDRIELRLGDARRLLPHFKPRTLLDFVYIDADVESYDFYFEIIVPYVRPGGLIIFDNTLRGGQVFDPILKQQPINRALQVFNRKLAIDLRVQAVLLPLANGFTACRKLFVAGMDGRELPASR